MTTIATSPTGFVRARCPVPHCGWHSHKGGQKAVDALDYHVECEHEDMAQILWEELGVGLPPIDRSAFMSQHADRWDVTRRIIMTDVDRRVLKGDEAATSIHYATWLRMFPQNPGPSAARSFHERNCKLFSGEIKPGGDV